VSQSFSSLTEELWIAERFVLEIASVVSAFTAHVVDDALASSMLFDCQSAFFSICHPSVKKSVVNEDSKRMTSMALEMTSDLPQKLKRTPGSTSACLTAFNQQRRLVVGRLNAQLQCL
jgi:hypothetical protein